MSHEQLSQRVLQSRTSMLEPALPPLTPDFVKTHVIQIPHYHCPDGGGQIIKDILTGVKESTQDDFDTTAAFEEELWQLQTADPPKPFTLFALPNVGVALCYAADLYPLFDKEDVSETKHSKRYGMIRVCAQKEKNNGSKVAALFQMAEEYLLSHYPDLHFHRTQFPYGSEDAAIAEGFKHETLSMVRNAGTEATVRPVHKKVSRERIEKIGYTLNLRPFDLSSDTPALEHLVAGLENAERKMTIEHSEFFGTRVHGEEMNVQHAQNLINMTSTKDGRILIVWAQPTHSDENPIPVGYIAYWKYNGRNYISDYYIEKEWRGVEVNGEKASALLFESVPTDIDTELDVSGFNKNAIDVYEHKGFWIRYINLLKKVKGVLDDE